MNINQANLHLHQRATATAWPQMRAAGFFFALLASSAFSALASAAVVAPVKLPSAAATLNADDLVTIDDVLAEVGAPPELMADAALGMGTATRDSHRKNNSPNEPTDTPLGDSEDTQQLNYGLLPVSSSTTSAGGAGSGGGTGGMMALAGAVAAHLSVDCTITRLVLADQLFPPSPPLCGIFHPPRALSSATLCA